MMFIAGKYQLDLSKKTHLMGIVNVTPDSFSDGGQFLSPDNAVAHARMLIANGADLIDLGAESTRPGAEAVSTETQLERLLPVMERLGPEATIPLSIDTTNATVAAACLKKGASVINDVSGLRADPDMARVIREFNAGCVLMHMRGTPKTMQSLADFEDVLGEICNEIEASAEVAMAAGIPRAAIIIDPGLGFAKKKHHNFMLIKNLKRFKSLGFPILMGPSRKSFLEVASSEGGSDDRSWQTAACVAICVYEGAEIIRVHDIKNMRRVVQIAESCRMAPSQGN